MLNKNERKIDQILSRAYILGGSPCSGKSTVADRISSRFELEYYKIDDHYQEHMTRCDPKQHPVMCKVVNMEWDELWMRPPEALVREEIAYYREQFEMILAPHALVGATETDLVDRTTRTTRQHDPIEMMGFYC